MGVPTAELLPSTTLARAVAVARGPHECPCCSSATWTEPPTPWEGLRDYVTSCTTCSRPLAVHVDRRRIMRRGAVQAGPLASRAAVSAVDELLDTPGARAFLQRVALAALAPILCALAVVAIWGAGPTAAQWAGVAALAGVVPGAMWAPALVASARDRLRGTRRAQRRTSVITIERAPWRAWQQELRRAA